MSNEFYKSFSKGKPCGDSSIAADKTCRVGEGASKPLVTKLSVLKKHMASGEWKQALAMAAKFPQLGEHKVAITRAHDAIQNPSFYEQIKKNPQALIDEGIAALKARYPD